MAIRRFTCSLRLSGNDLVPDEITRLLGSEPTKQYCKGEVQTFKSGRTRTYKYGFWSLDANDDSADPDEQIADILSRVSNDLSVWATLSRFQPDLYCGLFLEGYTCHALILSGATQKLLGERGVELDVQIYPPLDNEIRLGRLQVLGTDLNQRHPVRFWIKFPEKNDAEYAAGLLIKDGFEAQVCDSPSQAGFLVTFVDKIVPTTKALEQMNSTLWDLCSGKGWGHNPRGDYIGWYAEPGTD